VRRRSLLPLLLSLVLLFPAGASLASIGEQEGRTQAQPSVGSAAAHPEDGGDFNGDGIPDLAISAPEDDVGAVVDAGVVNVLYGGARGLQLLGNQFWTQDSPNILDEAEKGDFFGRSLGVGDFDGDGFDDLAVAAIREHVIFLHAGGVNVIYGSAGGLNAAGNQFWTEDSPGIPDDPGRSEVFGGALHAADWNNDGFDDLAISAWCDTVDGQECAGLLFILFGSVDGLTADGVQTWSQASPGMAGDGPEFNDQFGRQVADGDFNADGFLDIAIGCRLEEVDGHVEAGAAIFMYGTATGLTTAGSQFITQDTPGLAGDGAEDGDWFGRPVTVGNYNGDAYDDLLIGSRFEDVGDAEDAGSAHVLYGSATGLIMAGSQFWTQEGLKGDGVEEGDEFGHQAGAGDFDADGFDDVALGPLEEDVGLVNTAGAINVLYGSASGLAIARNQYITQDSPNVPDEVEDGDWFSFYLWSKDYNQDGYDDLAASAPGDTVDGVDEAGMIIVFNGSPLGIRLKGSKLFSQNTLHMRGDGAEDHDLMGGIMA
jgi:hypothetical protein